MLTLQTKILTFFLPNKTLNFVFLWRNKSQILT